MVEVMTSKQPRKPARLRDLEREIGDPEEARFAYDLERGKTKGDVISTRAPKKPARRAPVKKAGK